MEKSYLIGNIKMSDSKQLYLDTLSKIQSDGLYKKERTITTSQNININTVLKIFLISSVNFLI